MKRWSLALAVCAAASSAMAQPRPLTLNMSCAQTRGLVARSGAIVLGTGTHTYDRYVRSINFCQINETLEPAWVPTADTPQCPVGYRCTDSELDLFDD